MENEDKDDEIDLTFPTGVFRELLEKYKLFGGRSKKNHAISTPAYGVASWAWEKGQRHALKRNKRLARFKSKEEWTCYVRDSVFPKLLAVYGDTPTKYGDIISFVDALVGAYDIFSGTEHSAEAEADLVRQFEQLTIKS